MLTPSMRRPVGVKSNLLFFLIAPSGIAPVRNLDSQDVVGLGSLDWPFRDSRPCEADAPLDEGVVPLDGNCLETAGSMFFETLTVALPVRL